MVRGRLIAEEKRVRDARPETGHDPYFEAAGIAAFVGGGGAVALTIPPLALISNSKLFWKSRYKSGVFIWLKW